MIDSGDFVYVLSTHGSIQISKAQHGSLLILQDQPAFTDKGNLKEYEIIKFNGDTAVDLATTLSENAVIGLYSALLKPAQFNLSEICASKPKFIRNNGRLGAGNRGYIKHIVRMRYR